MCSFKHIHDDMSEFFFDFMRAACFPGLVQMSLNPHVTAFQESLKIIATY